jgi:2-polyprenyl-6-methoxyphenol hydroxylase-like FAD-dependent oxidoreductase
MIMTRSDVLIVGAGPTGLVLALWLTKLGAKIRIIDKTAEPGTTSRALAVHARTLELYRQLGLADIVVARGHKVAAVQLWLKGEPKARVSFEQVGAEFTRYSFLQIFPQDEHERLLIASLEGLGVSVERKTELLGYSDESEHVIARLRGPDGQEERCQAAYIAGCDGVRSIVRRGIRAAPTVISFMSRMSRRPARQSMVSCMSTLKRLISSGCFRSPGRDEPG